jgi:tRNA (cytidine/uridine-2'-O-)-methyltransferase
MFHIILFEPEIPPNTGNIIRLCANSGAHLHLIEPLGFELDDKRMRRAGLDYREWAEVKRYESFESFLENSNTNSGINKNRIFACTTKTKQSYHTIEYKKGDAFLFGPETRGLSQEIREQLGEKNNIRIPMKAESRSLNLANSVSIILFEALRQLDFPEHL